MAFTVYILKCKDSTLYSGYTSDMKQRLEEHNTSKKGAKYTRSRRPVKVVYSEKLESKESAMKRESEIKKLSRQNKLELIQTATVY